jgi:hypothetical protein
MQLCIRIQMQVMKSRSYQDFSHRNSKQVMSLSLRPVYKGHLKSSRNSLRSMDRMEQMCVCVCVCACARKGLTLKVVR